MATAADIIQAAYREGNLIPVGKQPTADEQAEALARLNAYMMGVFGFEMGEKLEDWLVPVPQRTAPVAANYPQLPLTCWPLLSDPSLMVYPYPPKNSRIVFGGIDTTVYFPESPDDGSRMALSQGSGAGVAYTPGSTLVLDGNGRTIEGTATVNLTTPVTARQWFYRADLADWVALIPLTAGSTIPFPTEFDDLWITALHIRLAPLYSKAATDETKSAFANQLSKFKTRYRQEAVTVYGANEFPSTSQSFGNGWRDW